MSILVFCIVSKCHLVRGIKMVLKLYIWLALLVLLLKLIEAIKFENFDGTIYVGGPHQ